MKRIIISAVAVVSVLGIGGVITNAHKTTSQGVETQTVQDQPVYNDPMLTNAEPTSPAVDTSTPAPAVDTDAPAATPDVTVAPTTQATPVTPAVTKQASKPATDSTVYTIPQADGNTTITTQNSPN